MADPKFSNVTGNIAEPVLDYGDDGDTPGNRLIVRLGTVESVPADTVADYVPPDPSAAPPADSDDEAQEAADSAAKDAEIASLKEQLAAAQAAGGATTTSDAGTEGTASADPPPAS